MGKKEEFLRKQKNGELSGEDLFLVLEAMKEIGNDNEDIKELLEDLKEEGEDIAINFNIGDKKAYFRIGNGEIETGRDKFYDNATVTITMDEQTALDILNHKISMAEAYKTGKIKAEGNLMKVAALGLMLNIVSDELELV